MRKLKVILVIILLASAGFLFKYYRLESLRYYTPMVMQDQMQVMIKEVAVIESFSNEFVRVIPEGNNVLLISVIEAYNTTGRDIEPNGYFKQTVEFGKEEFSSRMFSVYQGEIKNNKKRYIYLISELPYDVISKKKVRGVKLSFNFGIERKEFKDRINNEYGFQDLISSTHKKILAYTDEYNQYWDNDLHGFRKMAQDREASKNYQYLYDFIENIQKEYRSKVEILNINLEQMEELNLITPIYPDANIKLIKDTIFVRNRLEAIVNTENTADTKEGLALFIKGCISNIELAEQNNNKAMDDLAKQIKEEKNKL